MDLQNHRTYNSRVIENLHIFYQIMGTLHFSGIIPPKVQSIFGIMY